MATIEQKQIQQRYGTTAQWLDSTLVMIPGEIGVELINGYSKVKIGNGNSTWANLKYLLEDELATKAEAFTLKTINNQSLFGTGNIAISGGVTSHPLLEGRDNADQHTIGSITNLQSILDSKEPKKGLLDLYTSQTEKDFWNEKQPLLQSTVNIKTINGISLLGSGNIDISGGGTIPTKLSDLENDINFDDRYFTEQETTDFLNAKENNLPVTPSLPLTKYLNGNKEWAEISGFASTDHNHNGVYEPEITTKNTAFNKNFGTTADTVCAGNDARLSDARTPTTHEQAISTITGLQTALDSKMAKTVFYSQSSLSIDGNNGNFILSALSANAAFSLSNIETGIYYYVVIYNNGSSAITITLPNTVDIKASSTVSINAGKRKELAFVYNGTARFWQISEELT